MDAIAFPYRYQNLVGELPKIREWPKRPLRRVSHMLYHRNTVADTPEEIARWYIEHKRWPSCPYHFMIDWVDGAPLVYQTAALRDIVWGVRFYNACGIHIGFNEDYRTVRPREAMLAAGACLASDLLVWFAFERGQTRGRGTIKVQTHTEAALALSPKRWMDVKKCPGKHFDADDFRFRIGRIINGIEHDLPVLTVGEPWWTV